MDSTVVSGSGGLAGSEGINYSRDTYYREQMKQEKNIEGKKRGERVDNQFKKFTKLKPEINALLQRIKPYEVESECSQLGNLLKEKYRKVYLEHPDLFTQTAPDPDDPTKM